MSEQRESNRADGEAPGRREAATAVLDDLNTLRHRAGLAERKRDEYLALLQRTQADFENYQKRVQRDLADERRYAHAGLARELLRVMDNLSRTLTAARTANDCESLVRGVTLVQTQLLDIFARFGIRPIDAEGRAFDPLAHEAVVQQVRIDVQPGTVVEVLEPGYRLHDRVLRPAQVAVAAAP